jgi:hypothetical protein
MALASKTSSKKMENNQQPKEGDNKVEAVTPVQVEKPAEPPKPETKPTDNPAAEATDAKQPKEDKTTATAEPAKEMTAEQFELYNETLRRVSKTAKTDLQTRYNAFEDAEVRTLVKMQILADEKPNIKDIAAGVVIRLTPKAEPQTEAKPKATKKAKEADEVVVLKAELALVKAGIVPERLEAAKKLFIAEGGDPEKATEFVAKYPEWKAGATTGVTFTKAPPVAGKTAPNPTNQHVLNDFERKVAAARKKAGLD